MHEPGCAREEELLDALQSARWPRTSEPRLREHVASCVSCTELLAVAAPLLDDRHALLQEASVPPSAIVWWRAQRRSRLEAEEKAAQPISVVFGIAAACAAGLLATALGLYVPTFRRALGWTSESVGAWPVLLSSPLAADPRTSPMALAAMAALGLCLLVAPLALYFTFRED